MQNEDFDGKLNYFSFRLPSGQGQAENLACIEIDDVGGGGFAGVTITGNTCGEDPALAGPGRPAPPVGVRLARTPRTWRSVLIANNNFGATREGLAGFASPEVRAATHVSGNVGTGPGDAPTLADAGSGSPDVRIAHLRADVVRAESVVPAPEPALALELAAHATYAIEGHLRIRAAGPTTGLALDLGAPRGATASVVARASGDAAGVLLTGSPAMLPLAAGDDAVSLSGTLSTGDAGTFALRWAQGTAQPSPLVLQAGSWLRATKLP